METTLQQIYRNSGQLNRETTADKKVFDEIKHFEQNVTHLYAKYGDIEAYVTENGIPMIYFKNHGVEYPLGTYGIQHAANKSRMSVSPQTFHQTKKVFHKGYDKMFVDLEKEYQQGYIDLNAYERLTTKFDAYRKIPDANDLLIDIFREAKTENDYKFVIYKNVVRAILGKDNPYNSFKIHEYLDAALDYMPMKGYYEPKIRLNFNVDTGNVYVRLLYGMIDVQDAQVNDQVGAGVTVATGYYANSGIYIRPYFENLACTNGMTQNRLASKLALFYATHASEKSLARAKLYNWINDNHDAERRHAMYKAIDEGIMTNLQNGFLPNMYSDKYNMHETDRFYPLIHETVMSIMDNKIQEREKIYKRALEQSMTMEDVEKEIAKLKRKNFSWFDTKEQELLMDIFRTDETMPNINNLNRYYYAQGISRLANGYTGDQMHNLQDYAEQIMVSTTTI